MASAASRGNERSFRTAALQNAPAAASLSASSMRPLTRATLGFGRPPSSTTTDCRLEDTVSDGKGDDDTPEVLPCRMRADCGTLGRDGDECEERRGPPPVEGNGGTDCSCAIGIDRDEITGDELTKLAAAGGDPARRADCAALPPRLDVFDFPGIPPLPLRWSTGSFPFRAAEGFSFFAGILRTAPEPAKAEGIELEVDEDDEADDEEDADDDNDDDDAAEDADEEDESEDEDEDKGKCVEDREDNDEDDGEDGKAAPRDASGTDGADEGEADGRWRRRFRRLESLRALPATGLGTLCARIESRRLRTPAASSAQSMSTMLKKALARDSKPSSRRIASM